MFSIILIFLQLLIVISYGKIGVVRILEDVTYGKQTKVCFVFIEDRHGNTLQVTVSRKDLENSG